MGKGIGFRNLRAVDALIIAFTLLLSVIIVVCIDRVHEWTLLIPINFLSCVGIFFLAQSVSGSNNRLLQFIHDWYSVPSIFLLFKEVYVIIQSLGRSDWDQLLIAIDRAFFHGDPTIWISQFSSPLLTELLQLAYVSYYFIMLALGIELYVRREKQKFSFILFTILYGFFLSYLGYLTFPAVGPRFTLHTFESIDHELPGLFLTNALRDFLNAGESIPKNVVNPYALAQRDAFPSGHTEMTLIVIFLAHRYRLSSRYAINIAGTLLIISTIYLRYHYAIDLFGGALLMIFTVWTAPKLFRWWERRENSQLQFDI
jgi:membrane-associated phospholipid phosphatase